MRARPGPESERLRERLKTARSVAGLSAEALASATAGAGVGVPISRPSIAKFEVNSGVGALTVDQVAAIAAVFGVTIDDLVTPDEDAWQRTLHQILDARSDR